MKKIFVLVLILFVSLLLISSTDEEAKEKDSAALTNVGQMVPSFNIVTIDGSTIDILKMKGKVVLINFFADWCPPCKKEMPYLEKDIWQKYKDKDFILLGVGRENTAEVVRKFKEDFKVTFPMGPDPKREIYGKFATKFIPRNIVVDKNGIIIYQARGYNDKEFAHMISVIDKALQ